MRRVVITGMGAITPIGLNVQDFWEGLKAGKAGFREYMGKPLRRSVACKEGG